MANINFLPNDFESSKTALLEYFRNSDDVFLKRYFDNYSEGSTLSYVVDLLAYGNTYFNYMTNVNANEPFLSTAQIDRNIYAGAESLGYKPHRKVASSISYRITLSVENSRNVSPSDGIISIPQYSQFKSSSGIIFSLMTEVKLKKTDKSYFKNETTINGNVVSDNDCIFRAYTEENGITYFDCSESEQKRLNDIKKDDIKIIFKPLYFTFKQGYYIINTYKSNGNKNQTFSINRTDVDDSNSSIIVSSLLETNWEELTSILMNMSVINNKENDGTYSLLSSLSEKPLYLLTETPTGLNFKFGDGIIGKKLDANDMVFVRLFVTEGENGNKEKGLYSTDSVTCENVTISEKIGLDKFALIVNSDYSEGSAGGASKQSAESVREIAPYLSQSQGRIVSDVDYRAFILGQDMVNVSDCKVISGEKYTPSFLGGSVIIVGKIDDSVSISDTFDLRKVYYLSENDKLMLKSAIETKCVVGNDNVLFVDPQYIYIAINGSAYYDSKIFDKSAIENEFNSYNLSYFNSVNSFNNFFKMSKYVAGLLNTTNIDYVNLTTNMFIVKKLNKDEFYDTNIYISIENGIEKGKVTSEFTVEKNSMLCGLNYDSSMLTYFDKDNQNYLKVIDVNKVINGDYVSENTTFSSLYNFTDEDGNKHYPMYYAYSMYDEDGNMKIKESVFEWLDGNGNPPKDTDEIPVNIDANSKYSVRQSDMPNGSKSPLKSISATVGTVNYEKGEIVLNMSLYEAMETFERYRFYDLIPMNSQAYENEFVDDYYSESAIPSLIDLLFRVDYPEGIYDGKSVFFTLNFKLDNTSDFLNSGTVLAKMLGNPSIEYKSM